MPTLGAFHQQIRDGVNLGSTVDAQILAATRQAVAFLEQNYDFRYMTQRYVQFFGPVAQGAAGRGPYALTGYIKKMIHVYTYESFTDFTRKYFMERIDDQDFDSSTTGRPTAYSLRPGGEGLPGAPGTSAMLLMQTPDRLYYGVVEYKARSVWATGLTVANMYTSTYTHYLLEEGEQTLQWQTILALGPFIRDDGLMAAAKASRDDALRALLLADDEFEESDRSDIMYYRGYAHGRDENA